MTNAERHKKDYYFFKSIGICTMCRKNKVLGRYTICPECIEKKSEYNAKYRASDNVKENSKKYAKNRYYEHKKNGICVDCNKKATHGIYCYECRIKRTKRNLEYAQKKRLERAESRETAKLSKEDDKKIHRKMMNAEARDES